MAISQVRALVNGTWHVLTYNGSTGKYEKSITAPSVTSFNQNVDRAYYVTVEATNTAGTVVTKDQTDATLGSSLKLAVKEKVAPTITLVSPGNLSTVQNARQPVVVDIVDEANGSGVKVADVTVQVDSGAVLAYNAAGVTYTSITNGYRFTYTPQADLTDGSHTVKFNAKDNDGNSAIQLTLSMTVDTIPPTLSVTAPSNNFIRNTAAVTVTGTTNDVTSSPVTVTIKLNGVDQGAVTVSSGSFSKAITLANGSNTIVVRSTDGSGRYTEVTITGTLDTSQPTISAVSLTPNPVDAGATVLIAVTVTG